MVLVGGGRGLSRADRGSVPYSFGQSGAAKIGDKEIPMSEQAFRVGMIGLGFGAEMIPIHQAHPLGRVEAICQRNREHLDRIGDTFGIAKRFTEYRALLEDPAIDLVHINSPIEDHAPMTITALQAGKHVMCTVPMATTLEQCEEIVDLVRKTGLRYMMAETVVYSREFLFIKDLYDRGELGRIQYLAASHPQDMDGWPDYWMRMIPMHYATHVVSPVLGMVNARAEYVACFGSGTARDDIAAASGNAHAVQSCLIKFKDMDLSAHIWRFLYDVARQYRESIDVYGSKKSFEWELKEGAGHVLHTAKEPESEIAQPATVPDFAHRLPEPIRKFTQSIEDADHLSFVQGGGHGGSHPHMVHEMLSALAENRDPWPSAVTAANWTCVGICANQSSQQGGAIVPLPAFTLES